MTGSVEGDYAKRAREVAAAYARIADCLDLIRQDIAATHAQAGVPVADGLLDSMDAMSQRAKLTGSVSASEALALDHLHAQGGPDNPEAVAEYEEAARFHVALLPTNNPPRG